MNWDWRFRVLQERGNGSTQFSFWFSSHATPRLSFIYLFIYNFRVRNVLTSFSKIKGNKDFIAIDDTMFTADVGWIASNLIIILFWLRNLHNLCIKWSENKSTICLVYLFFLGCNWQFEGFVSAGFSYLLNFSLFIEKGV